MPPPRHQHKISILGGVVSLSAETQPLGAMWLAYCEDFRSLADGGTESEALAALRMAVESQVLERSGHKIKYVGEGRTHNRL